MSKTPEQLFSDLTPLQQAVVMNVLKGMSQRQAYMHSGLGDASSVTAIDSSASMIMNNPRVKAYLKSLQQESYDESIMGRDEMRRRLTVLARTDLKDLVHMEEVGGKTVWRLKNDDEIDPLKRAAISELTFTKQGPKIKTHSALAAMKQLAELDGLEAPKRSEVDHSSRDGSMTPKGGSLADFYADAGVPPPPAPIPPPPPPKKPA